MPGTLVPATDTRRAPVEDRRNSTAPTGPPRVRMGKPAGRAAPGGPGRPEVIRAAFRARVVVGGSPRLASRPRHATHTRARARHDRGHAAAERDLRAAVRRLQPA